MPRVPLPQSPAIDGIRRDSRTLADRVFSRSRVMDLILILTGAELTAILAQVTVPVWPVPVTGQVVGVVVVGFGLGLMRGTLAILAYLTMGLAGLPVYSSANAGLEHLLGPTGGYLLGFVPAVMLAGFLAARGWDRTFWRAAVAGGVCSLVIYSVGVPWLAVVNGYDAVGAIEVGLLPLVVGSVVKVLVIAAAMAGAWSFILRADARFERAAKRPGLPFSWSAE